jgi:copper chaperone CopZ
MRRNSFIAIGLLLWAGTSSAGTIEMKVNGLVCAFCAQGIEKTLKAYPATADVVVSLENRLVAVATKEGQDIPDAELTKALTDAGYTLKSIARTQTPIAEIREQLRKKPK